MIFVHGTGGAGKIAIPTSITVTNPTKTAYTAGELVNLTGLVVKAQFTDGSEQIVTSECTVSPAAGERIYEDTDAISITYVFHSKKLGVDITQQASIPVTVTRVLTSVVLTSAPSKLTYHRGEALSYAGMVMTAHFNSGRSEDVTPTSYNPVAGAVLDALGETTCTVGYSEGGVSKSASFKVNVTVKIVAWATGSDQEIADMVAAADAGAINLSEYWEVGQERTVHLSAMAATGVGESHVAQDVTFVLMNAGGKTLDSGETCHFIVGQKNGLANGTSGEYGYMNSSNTNSGGWDSCARRSWCNNVYKAAIPDALRPIFKPFRNITADGSGTTTKTSVDTFALASEKEIFGTTTYADSTAEASNSQFKYYETASNRIKKQGDTGSAGYWWERSPYSGGTAYFCYVGSGGAASYIAASSTYLLAPFGCI